MIFDILVPNVCNRNPNPVLRVLIVVSAVQLFVSFGFRVWSFFLHAARCGLVSCVHVCIFFNFASW